MGPPRILTGNPLPWGLKCLGHPSLSDLMIRRHSEEPKSFVAGRPGFGLGPASDKVSFCSWLSNSRALIECDRGVRNHQPLVTAVNGVMCTKDLAQKLK